MFGVGPMEIAILVGLTFGGFLGVPLSLPPLPADPVLQRALPDECLLAVHLYGRAEPDAASTNATEQLLAEKEVQQFVTQVGSEIVKFVRQKSEGDPRTEKLAAELPGVLHALATRPLSFYVAKFDVTAQSPDLRLGLVLNAGERAAALEASLNELQGLLLAEAAPGAEPESVEIAGVKLWKLPTPPRAPGVVWGFKQQLLIIAIGADSAQDLIARLEDGSRQPPRWFTALQKKLPVERVSAVSYVNVKSILQAAEPALQDPEARAVIAAMGIDELRGIGAVTGMTAKGAAHKTWIALNAPKGIFAQPAARGLGRDDLTIIPSDAVMAHVFKLNLAHAYQLVLAGVGEVNPDARERLDAQLEQAAAQIGLNLKEGLLEPLGDTWSVFSTHSAENAAEEFAITISLRDRDKFAATHDQLLKIVKQALAQGGQGKLSIQETKDQGVDLYQLQGAPVSPQWCVTQDRLIVAQTPQLMKRLLTRTPQDKSLADAAEVQARLASGSVMRLSYQDTRATTAAAYTQYQALKPMIQAQLTAAGVDLQLPALPAETAVLPHLHSQITTTEYVSGGVLNTSAYALPIAGGLDSTTVGVGVALLLPAVQASREAARRNVSVNNLKQIALSMFNHEAAYKTFPAQAITDKQGKPLLSWRVKLLPFLEENELYEEFHLDEPWDSEHNKKLIPRMPGGYLHPSYGKPGEGVTHYLVTTGKSGFFQDKAKGIKMREVTDGLSHTILVVEVDEKHGVPWTKPDDLEIDPKNPLAGLKDVRAVGFYAAFADGSVRLISKDLDPKLLPALFTPAGGEPRVELP